jgi:hypothetical protein
MKIKYGRTKKDLTLEHIFPPPFEQYKLKISALPEAWEALYILYYMKPEYVEGLIFHFAMTAYKELHRKRGRGVQSGREDFMHRMKWYTAYIYHWVNYWFKKSPKEWPNSLRKIIKEGGNQLESFTYLGKEKRLRTDSVTAYIMEKRFGKERKRQGLKKWTDDSDTFRRTFISNNKYAKFIKSKFKELLESGKFDISDLPL